MIIFNDNYKSLREKKTGLNKIHTHSLQHDFKDIYHYTISILYSLIITNCWGNKFEAGWEN